jgi:hypothetical protein
MQPEDSLHKATNNHTRRLTLRVHRAVTGYFAATALALIVVACGDEARSTSESDVKNAMGVDSTELKAALSRRLFAGELASLNDVCHLSGAKVQQSYPLLYYCGGLTYTLSPTPDGSRYSLVQNYGGHTFAPLYSGPITITFSQPVYAR